MRKVDKEEETEQEAEEDEVEMEIEMRMFGDDAWCATPGRVGFTAN